MKAFFNWSGGKDSALALYKAKQNGIPVEALVTTVNKATNRVSMHGVRRHLLEAQAAAIGLPLYIIEVPEMPGMEAYEIAVRAMHKQLKERGFTHAVFGDIFLEDLKAYRQSLLAKDDLQCLFPIWKTASKELLQEFWAEEFKAIVICTNSNELDECFCGRQLDESFVKDLPVTVDVCGENGEYHSFVYEGPIFAKPVVFTKGNTVIKEYASPIRDSNDDCFTTPQPAMKFCFLDLLPNA